MSISAIVPVEYMQYTNDELELAINPRTWTGTSWDEELNVGTSFYVKYNASDQGSPVTVGMPDNSNNNVLASMTVLFY